MILDWILALLDTGDTGYITLNGIGKDAIVKLKKNGIFLFFFLFNDYI